MVTTTRHALNLLSIGVGALKTAPMWEKAARAEKCFDDFLKWAEAVEARLNATEVKNAEHR